MDIDDITHEDVVLSLVKRATEYKGTDKRGIRGSKVLHKSMYFLNEKFRLFGFRWGDHGPLSDEIHLITEDLVDMGDISVTKIPTKSNGAFIPHMEYSPTVDSYFEGLEIPKELDSELDKIMEFTAGKSPRDLELFASVHYWAVEQKEMSGEYSAEYIFQRLTEMRPDAGFEQSDVENAIKILVDQKYL